MKPIDVNHSNEKKVFDIRYKVEEGERRAASFNVGDVVRVRVPQVTFVKESEPQFSAALHQISEAPKTHPHVYRVQRLDGKGDPIGTLEKGFYSPELSIVHQPDFALKVLPSPPKRHRPI